MYEEPSFTTKFLYDFTLWLLGVIFDCFFREIRPRNAYKIPKIGPVIFVAAPHANQFVDPVVLMGQVRAETNRRVSFLIAEKSLSVNGVGQLARLAMSIPVKRAQDNLKKCPGTIKLDPADPLRIIGEGTEFTKHATAKGLIGLPKAKGNAEIAQVLNDHELLLKREFKKSAQDIVAQGTEYLLAAKIDQSEVYEKVFAHLHAGNSLGIFPEGGSHDRTDLLPLKAGVAIMALGAMKQYPGLDVKIVPCGMNYFHAHKFRSRAVVEFGDPISVSADMLEKYSNGSKEAVQELLDTITDGLKAVTVSCPDYETLMVVQAARRLYTRGKNLPIALIVEMNRRLVIGYNHYKENPEIIELKKKVLKYNENLKQLNLPDHEVERAQVHYVKNFFILCSRSIKLLLLLVLAMPGIVLFTPVFVIGKWYSNKKKKAALANSVVKVEANDVVATWKILIGMGLAPVLYTFYSILGLYYFRDYKINKFVLFWAIYIAGATVTYSALICGDTGMDIFKSIRPIYLSLVKPEILLDLKTERRELSESITDVVNRYGRELFPDFDDLKKMDVDEQLEDKKTQELRRRRQEQRRLKRKQEKRDTDSDSSSISSSFFNSSDEADSEGEAAVATGTAGSVRDKIRHEMSS